MEALNFETETKSKPFLLPGKCLNQGGNVLPFFAPDNLDVSHAKQKELDRKGGDKC